MRGKIHPPGHLSWLGGRNEGQFLPAAAGRTEAVMVMMKVVVVVGCFVASTACFLLQIPDPPYGYGRVEYRGKILVVRPPSDGQNDGNSDDGGKFGWIALICSRAALLSRIAVRVP